MVLSSSPHYNNDRTQNPVPRQHHWLRSFCRMNNSHTGRHAHRRPRIARAGEVSQRTGKRRENGNADLRWTKKIQLSSDCSRDRFWLVRWPMAGVVRGGGSRLFNVSNTTYVVWLPRMVRFRIDHQPVQKNVPMPHRRMMTSDSEHMSSASATRFTVTPTFDPCDSAREQCLAS